MAEKYPSKIDQLLDLLLDALQERQADRDPQQPVVPVQQISEPFVEPVPEPVAEPIPAQPPPAPELKLTEVGRMADVEPEEEMVDVSEQGMTAEPDMPEKLPTIFLDRMLGRLAIALLVLIVAINIPFNRYGTTLARAMPDRQALVIRDGLLLKSKGEEIYVLEDNHKRWISSLEAFTYYGYRWDDVNLVDDAFLEQFPSGPTLSILNKCATSPHIYAIENGYKRWIKDIPTFEAEGYVWDDVQFVSCAALEKIPSGPPIPPDAGEPPSP